MSYVVGEVNSTSKPDKSFPPASADVLLDDHPGSGFPTWVPLLGGGLTSAGSVCFDGSGLQLISPDVSTGTPDGQAAGCSVLSRDVRPPAAQRVYIRAIWQARSFHVASSVFQSSVGYEFGLDTSDWGDATVGGIGTGGLAPTPGNRTLAMIRCTQFDEGETKYYGGKWQINVGSADQARWRDLLDYNGNKIAPSTPGYERLLVGQNYAKTLRQYTEIVMLLTPQQITPVTSGGVTLTVTSASTAFSYTGTDNPILGGWVRGTSVGKDVFITGVNTGAKTGTLSVAASASTSTQAGAAYVGATITGRIEGLRHNGLGFGSLAGGATGYDRDTATNPRANELLNRQGLYDDAGTPCAAPACSRDVGFQGGMNHYVQIDNRSTQASKQTMWINRYKAVAF